MQKKAKETNGEKRISPDNRLEKINLGEDFFSSPAFPETKVFFLFFFFFGLTEVFGKIVN